MQLEKLALVQMALKSAVPTKLMVSFRNILIKSYYLVILDVYRSLNLRELISRSFYQVWVQMDTIVYKFPALNLEQCVLNGELIVL